MSKTLLVLGASRYQLPTITAATRLGMNVVVVDHNPDNPGHTIADKSYVVSTLNISETLGIALSEKVDGVIAPCTDVAVITAAHVSTVMGLPGIKELAAACLTDKERFRTIQSRLGFLHPRIIRKFSNSERVRRIELGSEAAIVKPNRASGSRGVRIVDASVNDSDFEKCCLDAQLHSTDGSAILEELVIGKHHTAEGVVLDGEIKHITVTERLTVAAPYTATRGHIVLPDLGDVLRVQLHSQILSLFRELDVSDSVFDCDFVVTADGTVVLLELTPRLGGNLLSEVVRESSGIDLVVTAIQMAVGGAIPSMASNDPVSAAVIILGLDRDGIANWSVEKAAKAPQHPLVRKISFDIPLGTYAMRFTEGRHRIGEVLIAGGDLAQVRKAVIEVEAAINLRAG